MGVHNLLCEIGQALVCRNGSLQGTDSIKPSHVAQQVLSNNSLWLGNPKRHCIPVVASPVMCRYLETCNHSTAQHSDVLKISSTLWHV